MIRFQKCIFLLLFCLCGCACPPAQDFSDTSDIDPLEKMNRPIFAFNMALDDYFITPLVRGYRAVIPTPIRTGLGNFLDNLKHPLYIGNSLLQGNWSNAGNLTKRMTMNTLFGFFGFLDPAEKAGITAEKADFGQTLGVYGLGTGPYLVLPVLGPSDFRDGIGTAVDALAMPIDYALKDEPALIYTRIGLTALSNREAMDDLLTSLRADSMDYYSVLRTMYLQNRAQKVAKDDQPAAYEFDFDD